MPLATDDLPRFEFEKAPVHQGCCIHAVNGVELVMDPAGVAYWPVEQTLLVADLHLEKGSSLARRGQMLPPYDTHRTLNRLAECVEKWLPRKVIALGDSFHEAGAADRLDRQARDLLSGLMVGRDWIWIAGNHDPSLGDEKAMIKIGGETMAELTHENLILRHEPQKNSEPGEIAGHLHPKARIVKRGRSVRRSCFAVSRNRAILPSFGAYTGGLNVLDRAFDGLFDGKNFYALMRGDDQLYRINANELR